MKPFAARLAFEVAARVFIETKESPGTRTVYKANLARWLAHCDEHKVKPTAPTLADASAFKAALKGADLAPGTVRQVLASLSGIYGSLAAKEKGDRVVDWNPFHPDALPWPAADDFATTKVVPVAVASKMIAAAEADASPVGPRDAAILHILWGTGMRRASVVGMRRVSICRQDGQVEVKVVVKGGKNANVELAPEVAAALDRWLEVAPKSAFVFPGRRPNRPLHVDYINKIVEARAKEVGAMDAEGKATVHPHSFRAAFVTSAFDAGLSLNEVQASVQHRDPKTTQRYDRGRRGVGVSAAVEAARKAKR